MPAPIVFRPQYGPLDSFLMNMFMQKFTHKQNMEIHKAGLEEKKLALEEQRTYQEGTQLKKEGRAETSKIAGENRAAVTDYKKKGWLTEDQIKDPVRKRDGMTKMVGGRLMYYPSTPNETETHTPVWENDKWKMVKKESLKAYIHPKDPNAKVVYKRPSERPPPGYLPYSSPLVTINNKPSIAEKQNQQNIAYFQSPKFSSDVLTDAKKLYGKMWDYYASEPGKQKELVRNIADAKVKAQFGSNAKFGRDKDTGDVGWFVPEGNGYKLVTPWGE